MLHTNSLPARTIPKHTRTIRACELKRQNRKPFEFNPHHTLAPSLSGRLRTPGCTQNDAHQLQRFMTNTAGANTWSRADSCLLCSKVPDVKFRAPDLRNCAQQLFTFATISSVNPQNTAHILATFDSHRLKALVYSNGRVTYRGAV